MCREGPLGSDDRKILGIGWSSCTKAELRKAYRKTAMTFHPDKYAGSKACAEMHFNRIQSAFEALQPTCK